ncbi:MAG: adaptor protein MecA [Lachnospiraceae bacterium]|nr:adaptor protein MecA [Lachnospiraceae bacterium]
MLIKKENKHSITCRVSKEELSARGFDNMEELMHDQVQARKLLNEVIEEARETVDFTAENGQINVQMVGLADGSISIRIFSDRKTAVRSMLEKYKDIAQIVNQQDAQQPDEQKPEEKDPDEGVEIDTIAPRFKGKQNISVLPAEKVTELLSATPEDTSVMIPVVLSFDDLEDAISLCRTIEPMNRYSDADLYKMDDRYYLTIDLMDTKKTLGNSIFAISEFSGRIENHGDIRAMLKEHGEVIRSKDAVTALAGL